MVPRSPDDVLWRYLELRERLTTAPAQNLIAETGLVFDACCRTCGAPAVARIIVTRDNGGRLTSTYRCGICQATWPAEIGFLTRNQVSGLRRGGIETPMSELATYALALSRLDRAQRRIYLQLYVYEGVGSYAAVAAAANLRWPRMRPPRKRPTDPAGPWTEWRVRSLCDAARRSISTGIARAAA